MAILCVLSGLYRVVTDRAVKVAAKFELDSLKAIGNAINANVLVAIAVCLTVRLRKFDAASHATFWASQVFSPLVSFRHPANMYHNPSVFQQGR
jgi:hypothetical protein